MVDSWRDGLIQATLNNVGNGVFVAGLVLAGEQFSTVCSKAALRIL